MKSCSKLLIATLVFIASAPSVRADTLNMPIAPPVTFNDQVDMKYQIVAGILGAPIGKFTATGRVVSTEGVAYSPKGTFSLTAYFDPTTGQIIKDHPTNNAFDPVLLLKNAAAVTLYESHAIRRFAYDLGVTYPTFDFEWYNGGGTLAALNPLPFIGTTLRNATTFTGTKSFISAAPIGTLVFDNAKGALNLEYGTANVFMTPTPSAVGGGAMLLGCLLVGGKMRHNRLARQATV